MIDKSRYNVDRLHFFDDYETAKAFAIERASTANYVVYIFDDEDRRLIGFYACQDGSVLSVPPGGSHELLSM